MRVAHLPAASVPRAVTPGETRGYLKAVVDADTDRVLGASILAVVRVAMLAGPPYTAPRDKAFTHPTMAEGLNDLFARLE